MQAKPSSAPRRAWARPMPCSRTRDQAEGGWTSSRAWSRHMAAQEDAALNHYSATSRRCASVSSAALTLCRQSKRKELSHATRTFQKLFGNEGGSTGLDDDFVARGFEHGSWAATLFGPIRGPWPDDNWKGWWGDEATYHCPVFVLTHHARPSITMQGGTVFHFVTNGIHAALQSAHEAANGKDVRLGGGVATIQQYAHAGLIDEMRIAICPVLTWLG